jgi:serine/threonine protein phosphatase PrpC
MITVFSHSEAGGHAVNEDAYIVQRHPDDSECWVCTLGDGQGGQPGGGPASKLACQAVADLALIQHPQELRNPRTWDAILHQADENVTADAYAGYTTLIGFCVHDNTLIGAANGDSAIAVFDSCATAGRSPQINSSTHQ